MSEEDAVARLLQEQRAMGLVDQVLKNATPVFDTIDATSKNQLMCGFTAALATSQLSGTPLAKVRESGTVTLQGLEGESLAVAMRTAAATSRSRTQAGQQFAAAVWGLLANALVCRATGRDLQGAAPKGESSHGATYAMNASTALLERLGRYIHQYAAASAEELRKVGLDGARIVDPAAGSRRKGWWPWR